MASPPAPSLGRISPEFSLSCKMLRVLDKAFVTERLPASIQYVSPLPKPKVLCNKMPAEVLKEKALKDILLSDDGSLRGGTIHKVPLTKRSHSLIFNRIHCSSETLLRELSRAYHERIEMNLDDPEIYQGALFSFLWEWIQLYFEQDFNVSSLRTELLALVNFLAPAEHKKLNFLILRQVQLYPLLSGSTTSSPASKQFSALLSPSFGTASLAHPFSNEFSSSFYCRPDTASTEVLQSAVVESAALRTAALPPAVIVSLSKELMTAPSDALLSRSRSSSPSPNDTKSILLRYKPEDIAKQLTMIEFQMYENVQPTEFHDNAWQASDKHTRAPFCTALVAFSNKVTAWIEHEILSHHGTRQVDALEAAIHLAEKCREIRNYNALMEVFSAISQVSITRLKASWARVGSKLRASFHDLDELLTPVGNFRKFREEIKSCLHLDVPILPYLGTFLRDILFANDGNPSKLTDAMLINWDKIHIVGNQINYFNRFKKLHFQFLLNVKLRDLLVALPAEYDVKS